MTRNGFMKLVNGSGKFYKDAELYEGMRRKYQEHPEYYAHPINTYFNQNLHLVYENAAGVIKNYICVGPTYKAGKIIPGTYTVRNETKAAVDSGASERTSFFEITPEDLDLLLNKHELTFGY